MAAGNDRPAASFTFACSGLTCTFDASASSDADGTITDYAWHFGDGTSASGRTASHTFAGGTTYSVMLVVMDDKAGLGGLTTGIDLNQPPIISFTWVCSGLKCTFDSSASYDVDGTIASCVWRFGDGGAGISPTHTYVAAGSYTVSLSCTDNASATGTRVQTVTVINLPPIASLTYACNGLDCVFDGSSSSDPDGTIAGYVWKFGDGTTASGAKVSHTYGSGIYTVTMSVTDNAGATSSTCETVTITRATMHVGDLDPASTSRNRT